MNDQLIATLKELTESVNCLRVSVVDLNKHLIDVRIAEIRKEMNKCCCEPKKGGTDYDKT